MVDGFLLRIRTRSPSTTLQVLFIIKQKAPDYSRTLNVFVLYLTITKLVINRVQILTPS